MTRAGGNALKRIIAEMALIVLVAVIVGIAWNNRLLLQAWTGRATPRSHEVDSRADTPLPLGLMQVKELFDRREALFVDARDATAFAAGHIKGAVSLPVGEAETRLPLFIATVPPAATLVAYCNGYDCHDSRDLGVRLMRAGYRVVYIFEGGVPEWRDAGYPTEGGAK